MKTDTLTLLARPGEIADYVMSLWTPDGPIARNHRDGGMVHRIVERFARLPRIFFEASEPGLEWTSFSPWWSAIQLAEYGNTHIRDLRYCHEIFHAATMPYARGMNLATMSARNAQNEREASTFSEMAIYLEIPELRALTFPHEIFADRFLYEYPAVRMMKRERLLQRWRHEPDVVFQELLYARLGVVLADDTEIDDQDPQVVWLRRYPESNDIWAGIWRERHELVDDAMVSLRERCEGMGRAEAARRHLDWLMSPAITDGGDVPFRREAIDFKSTFDRLIEQYDAAMGVREEDPVRSATSTAR